MRLLTVSDEIVSRLHSSALRGTVGEVDAIVGCGDLPPSYLEFLVSVLNVPAFFVQGNHDLPELWDDGTWHLHPRGFVSLDLRAVWHNGVLMAGASGVLMYREGAFQYSEQAWQRRLLLLSMRVFWAQQRYNRPLDALFCHTPPAGLHDGPGAHRGPLALRRFVERIQPRYVIHGHVHPNYGYGDQSPLLFNRSLIVNTCGYRVTELEVAQSYHEANVG